MEKSCIDGFVDIHNHILFGIDDGSQSLKISFLMLKMAQDEGIDTIVCTPHYHPVKCVIEHDEIYSEYEKLKRAAESVFPSLRIVLGREVFYNSDFEDKLEKWKDYSMAGSNYILTEYDIMSDYIYIKNSIINMKQYGCAPIIAHAERYNCLLNDWKLVKDLKDLGAYIQINSDSIVNPYTGEIKKFVRNVLKEHLADYVGTDAHDCSYRAPKMKKCAQLLNKKCGTAYTEALLRYNAMAVINNEKMG